MEIQKDGPVTNQQPRTETRDNLMSAGADDDGVVICLTASRQNPYHLINMFLCLPRADHSHGQQPDRRCETLTGNPDLPNAHDPSVY